MPLRHLPPDDLTDEIKTEALCDLTALVLANEAIRCFHDHGGEWPECPDASHEETDRVLAKWGITF